MTRYLIPSFIRSALGRGQAVEQFLGGFMHGEEPAVRWISVAPEDGEVVLSLHEVYDQGREDFLDLYDFTPIGDDGDEDGEPAAEHRVSTLEEALALAAERYGADPARFVNAGVVQDEYADHLARRAR